MLRGVDGYSDGRWHDALQALVDAQYRVLLLAAPSPALLRDPQALPAYRALPLAQRLKTRLKACVPELWFRRLRVLLPRR